LRDVRAIRRARPVVSFRPLYISLAKEQRRGRGFRKALVGADRLSNKSTP